MAWPSRIRTCLRWYLRLYPGLALLHLEGIASVGIVGQLLHSFHDEYLPSDSLLAGPQNQYMLHHRQCTDVDPTHLVQWHPQYSWEFHWLHLVHLLQSLQHLLSLHQGLHLHFIRSQPHQLLLRAAHQMVLPHATLVQSMAKRKDQPHSQCLGLDQFRLLLPRLSF